MGDPIGHFLPHNFPINLSEYFNSRNNTVRHKISMMDQRVELEITCNKLSNDPGKSGLLLFEVRDLKSARDDIVSNEALDKYSFLTSHALRAPLSTILSLSNALNDQQLASYDFLKIKELLANIQEQAEELDSIIMTINELLMREGYGDKLVNRSVTSIISSIVLVDDDVLINKIHEHLINRYHPQILVTTFNNPKMALEFISNNPPDLILLDINMPEIDGWEFLRRIDSANIAFDIIILSSSIDLSDKARASRFKQVKRFIEKPLNQQKIQSFLNAGFLF